MASKFSKFLFFTATAAAAAGVYYYMQKKNTECRQMHGVDDDEFDIYDEDLDAEPCKSRSYVSLNFDNASLLASEAYRRAKEKITEVKDTVMAGFEGASAGMREFVDLTREEASDIIDEVADEMANEIPKKAKDIGDDACELAAKAKKAAKDGLKNAEDGLKTAEKSLDKAEDAVSQAISEGVTKVEDFFDEDDS
ncbi:MAG: hypothetical protein FWG91_11770 [Lachnospiraceae bacterium]|nr:hypothetical protein [Lachnospiraceae bacterium]